MAFLNKDILIKLVEYKVDLIDIAYKFDELFSDMIEDKPIFSKELLWI